MFGNMGLHTIQYPTKKWGFVGSIPVALGEQVPATTSAVMGGRAFWNEKKELVEWKFPVFESQEAAIEFAKAKGCEVRS